MRVSTDRDDPGYTNLDHNYVYHAMIDGVNIEYAKTADEEAGYVVRAVNPFEVDGEGVLTETLYGNVVITKTSKEQN